MDINKLKQALPLLEQINALEPIQTQIQMAMGNNLPVASIDVTLSDPINHNPHLSIPFVLTGPESTQLLNNLKQLIKNREDALIAQIQAI